jgi:hypothetical protein
MIRKAKRDRQALGMECRAGAHLQHTGRGLAEGQHTTNMTTKKPNGDQKIRAKYSVTAEVHTDAASIPQAGTR